MRLRNRGGRTHAANDGRIVGHRRLILLGRSGRLFNAQILHIATSEDDEVVHLIRRRDLFGGVALSTFGAM
jgi:hypothetical protein